MIPTLASATSLTTLQGEGVLWWDFKSKLAIFGLHGTLHVENAEGVEAVAIAATDGTRECAKIVDTICARSADRLACIFCGIPFDDEIEEFWLRDTSPKFLDMI